jgi:predicted enzyme related to lactoylglutathione lyase
MVTPITHENGMPNWVDVNVETEEQQHDLRAFLSTIFDWTWDTEGEEMGFYSIASYNGSPVCGLGRGPGGTGEWTTYFKTTTIDETAAKAVEFGATVVMPVMKITDVGSMALLADPTGARFGLWQPDQFHGFDIAYEANALGWFDHGSPEPEVAGSFYTALNGHPVMTPGDDMRVLHNGDQWFASISNNGGDGEPRWNPIFVVDSLERIHEIVPRHGGTILAKEIPVPGSAICIFTEPVNGSVMTVMRGGHEAT